jgi:hypothetical protein
MTDTAILVKTIWQPRTAKGLKPMRVWGNEGITWPCITAGGRDGAEARVALATDLCGRPFETWTPTVGALGLRFATGAPGRKVESTGARVGNASVGRRKVGGIASAHSRESKVIIVFKQLIIVGIDKIRHPPPSGACHVPPLVLFTATKGVRGSSIVAVASGLDGAGCTSVILADVMAMHPAVVSKVWSLIIPPPSYLRHRWSHQCWSSLGLSHRIHQLLVGCSEHSDGGSEGQIG